MRRIIITIAALTLIPLAASAEEVYEGLAEDNPDLQGERRMGDVPPEEVGPDPDAEVYRGLGDENPDLPTDIETAKEPTEEDPEIYAPTQPNPDLSY